VATNLELLISELRADAAYLYLANFKDLANKLETSLKIIEVQAEALRKHQSLISRTAREEVERLAEEQI
jgi:hypothetical protein